MLISLGHGGRIYLVDQAVSPLAKASLVERRGEPGLVPISRAVPDLAEGPTARAASAFAQVEDVPLSAERFGFLFEDAASFPKDNRAAALDALAASMAEADGGGDSTVPAIVTYFGQFVDHDITANTNTERPEFGLEIGSAEIIPQDRGRVADKLRNLRKGSLRLDSVYGDGPIEGEETRRAMAAMRDGDAMRVGATAPTGSRPDLPGPEAGQVFADLPRAGDLVGPGRPYATPEELPGPLRPSGGSGERWKRKAFIGDSRNDENLILAQLHVAFLRFHNSVLRALGGRGSFEEARRLTTFHYQWILVHDYLPAICDAQVVARVIDERAPLYASFAERMATGSPDSLPLPFEFSAAAFRFGHSMVRAGYDYNRNFPGASLAELFAFTGNNPADPIGFGFERLPDNWIIEWDRFISNGSPMRNARLIDTKIAPPLFEMTNEGTAAGGLFQKLAARNLRRGHLLNLPPAQALIGRLNAEGFGPIQQLSQTELESGTTGDAVRAGGFGAATPLWFYILKEAEQGGGHRLGELGSRIVAETLVGLIVRDPQSYWNAHGGWDPDKGVKPGGIRVDSLAALLRVAGVL